MSNLPLLDKNAHLSIYVDSNVIYANLAYSHYEIGRNYTLSDQTLITDPAAMVSDDKFWWWYFAALENKLNWQLFDLDQVHNYLISPLTFQDEGRGVAEITLKISQSHPHIQRVVTSIREFCAKINISVLDNKKIGNILNDLGEKFDYRDKLYLDLNLMDFKVIRALKKDTKPTLDKKREDLFDIFDAKLRWDNRQALVENLRSSKFKAFLSVESNFEKLVNIWANFVNNPVLKSNNLFLADSVRALITLQLLSIFNDNFDSFKDFGNRSGRSALFISGDLIHLLDKRMLLVAVLDGLEINGQFDLYVDTNQKIITLGDIVAQGKNASKFIAVKEHALETPSKVIIPQLPSAKEKESKAVFNGHLISQQKGQRDIYALIPNINEFVIEPEEKTVIEGNFIKGASLGVEGLENKVAFISDPSQEKFSSLCIDCRPKPVVYGPGSSENRDKIKSWLQ